MRAPGTPLDGRPLGEGMHELGGARIRVDRRGHWLLVGDGVSGVHVNGRPVRRLAMLRPGDNLHVDGHAILLAADAVAPPPAPPPAQSEDAGPADARMLLRAIGGRHHGRGFTLDRARAIGSDAGADIRLDPPAAGLHARIGSERGRLVLRAGPAATVRVNGLEVRDAELKPGDQLLVGARDRFVVEAPCDADPIPEIAPLPDAGPALPDDGQRQPRRLPWLLLAALLIAAVISALLLL